MRKRARTGVAPWERHWAVAFVAALAAFQASFAWAGRIEGTVRLAPGPAPQQATFNPYPATLGSICNGTMTFEAATDDPHDVVLTLDGVPAGVRPAAKPRPLQLAQRNQMFEPRVLGVPVGSIVEFPNLDPIFHNVFSYSKAKRFDVGKYGQGKSARVTFDKPGLVKVFCDIHSNMTAFILVSRTPWVVQPDDKGHFALDGVPDGTYELGLWHPERGTRTVTVTVPGSPLHLDL
jgi:hypothetical protein